MTFFLNSALKAKEEAPNVGYKRFCGFSYNAFLKASVGFEMNH